MKYYFFLWDIYSNWRPSPILIDWILFKCVEQYFMYMKAITAQDQKTADLILKETDPSIQKSLWRSLDIDIDLWDSMKYAVMYEWVYEKFKQNDRFRKILLSEDCDLFVEASPVDRIWWIWYYSVDAMKNIDSRWENLLWKITTEVRDLLK